MSKPPFTYYLRRFWWQIVSSWAPITTGIVVINILLYLTQLWWLYGLNSIELDLKWALSNDGIRHGQYWQLLTYAWLHAENFPPHLIFNMMMIYFLGRQLEQPLGPVRFLILYFGGALAAALAWLWFDHGRSSSAVMGASGAVFALITAYGLYAPKRTLKAFILFVIPITMTARTFAFLLVLAEWVMSWSNFFPTIAHTAHIGGAVFGWAMLKIWKVRAGQFYPAGGPISRL